MTQEDKTTAATENGDEKGRKDSSPDVLSVRDQLLKVATHPGVITALVTAAFGSFFVAVATSWVTKSLGESKLQFEIVEALIEYTKDDDLKQVPAISRLEALTRLIADNDEQFSVKVDGFQKLVSDFKRDRIVEAREEAESQEAEKEQIKKQLSQEQNLSAEARKALEEKLASTEREIKRTSAKVKDAEEKYAADLRSGKMTLAALEATTAKLEEELAGERGTTERLRGELEGETEKLAEATRKLEEATRKHRVRMEIAIEDDTPNLLFLQFSDAPYSQAFGGIAEFVFSGRAPSRAERTVTGSTLQSLRGAKYVHIVNEKENAWAGAVTLFVDEQELLRVRIPANEELERGSRTWPVSEVLVR